MDGRRVECELGRDSQDDPVFPLRHFFDDRPSGFRNRVSRHDLAHLHHHRSSLLQILFDSRLAVDHQIRERPLFVENADRDFAEALHGLGLGATSHRRNQQIVAVHRVVDDRHGRRAFLALIPEHAGAMSFHECASLFGVHWCSHCAPPALSRSDPARSAVRRTARSGVGQPRYSAAERLCVQVGTSRTANYPTTRASTSGCPHCRVIGPDGLERAVSDCRSRNLEGEALEAASRRHLGQWR